MLYMLYVRELILPFYYLQNFLFNFWILSLNSVWLRTLGHLPGFFGSWFQMICFCALTVWEEFLSVFVSPSLTVTQPSKPDLMRIMWLGLFAVHLVLLFASFFTDPLVSWTLSPPLCSVCLSDCLVWAPTTDSPATLFCAKHELHVFALKALVLALPHSKVQTLITVCLFTSGMKLETSSCGSVFECLIYMLS